MYVCIYKVVRHSFPRTLASELLASASSASSPSQKAGHSGALVPPRVRLFPRPAKVSVWVRPRRVWPSVFLSRVIHLSPPPCPSPPPPVCSSPFDSSFLYVTYFSVLSFFSCSFSVALFPSLLFLLPVHLSHALTFDLRPVTFVHFISKSLTITEAHKCILKLIMKTVRAHNCILCA